MSLSTIPEGETSAHREKTKRWVAKEALKKKLYKLIALSGGLMTLSDLLLKDYFRALHEKHLLSSPGEFLLSHYLDYTGNAIYGMALYVATALVGHEMLRVGEKVTKSDLVGKIRTVWPYALFLVFAIYNIDTETGQKLVGSFGSPRALDMVAGFWGGIAGTIVVERFLQKRPHE